MSLKFFISYSEEVWDFIETRKERSVNDKDTFKNQCDQLRLRLLKSKVIEDGNFIEFIDPNHEVEIKKLWDRLCFKKSEQGNTERKHRERTFQKAVDLSREYFFLPKGDDPKGGGSLLKALASFECSPTPLSDRKFFWIHGRFDYEALGNLRRRYEAYRDHVLGEWEQGHLEPYFGKAKTMLDETLKVAKAAVHYVLEEYNGLKDLNKRQRALGACLFIGFRLRSLANAVASIELPKAAHRPPKMPLKGYSSRMSEKTPSVPLKVAAEKENDDFYENCTVERLPLGGGAGGGAEPCLKTKETSSPRRKKKKKKKKKVKEAKAALTNLDEIPDRVRLALYVLEYQTGQQDRFPFTWRTGVPLTTKNIEQSLEKEYGNAPNFDAFHFLSVQRGKEEVVQQDSAGNLVIYSIRCSKGKYIKEGDYLYCEGRFYLCLEVRIHPQIRGECFMGVKDLDAPLLTPNKIMRGKDWQGPFYSCTEYFDGFEDKFSFDKGYLHGLKHHAFPRGRPTADLQKGYTAKEFVQHCPPVNQYQFSNLVNAVCIYSCEVFLVKSAEEAFRFVVMQCPEEEDCTFTYLDMEHGSIVYLQHFETFPDEEKEKGKRRFLVCLELLKNAKCKFDRAFENPLFHRLIKSNTDGWMGLEVGLLNLVLRLEDDSFCLKVLKLFHEMGVYEKIQWDHPHVYRDLCCALERGLQASFIYLCETCTSLNFERTRIVHRDKAKNLFSVCFSGYTDKANEKKIVEQLLIYDHSSFRFEKLRWAERALLCLQIIMVANKDTEKCIFMRFDYFLLFRSWVKKWKKEPPKPPLLVDNDIWKLTKSDEELQAEQFISEGRKHNLYFATTTTVLNDDNVGEYSIDEDPKS
tara:strand:+ start:104 stop:2680 length:2577 start_codon:yes stop_codon:yes gene_type:complete